MSTLKTTNISHPNSAANDIVLDANGSVNVDSGTLYVDATNNRVGIGTSSPAALLEASSATGSATPTPTEIRLSSTTNAADWSTTDPWARVGFYSADTTGGVRLRGAIDTIQTFSNGNVSSLAFKLDDASTGLVERMRVTYDGKVGINTQSPGNYNSSANDLVIAGSDSTGITISATSSTSSKIHFADGTASTESYRGIIEYDHAVDGMLFATAANERARIDSSGRLLVGTTSAIAALEPSIQIARPSGAFFALGRDDTSITDDETLGAIYFYGYQGSSWSSSAWIAAMADGAWGTNDYPSKLVFSTTADGASSPTERMRIDSAGSVMIGTTSVAVGVGNTLNGVGIAADGYVAMSRSSGIAAYINRNTTDGTIVSLRQAGTEEGTISVSGTTVSYNGAHLSRWSQLPNGAERTEILRGSVLSNIDEMCEWGEEENEQLNRMKVSDVEGDKNVSGVFQAWDDDDDTYTNDFYCAMTGDFIIRIGAGVTVERGDLLMSAGDGTAKPQDDDIIRSKTIAKVTSTNVSCTYDDGSYCVPCVLMAC